MNEIKLVIIGLFFIDMIFTYLNAVSFKKKFPKKDYKLIELNPLVRYCWKIKGLKYGSILAGIIQWVILLILITISNSNFLYTFMGMYLMVIFIHLDNYDNLKTKNKEYPNWRKYIVVLLLFLSATDLTLTGIYISEYKDWQPNKPFNQMESNPLLVVLFNLFGLGFGLFIGILIIYTLLFIIGFRAGKLIIGAVILALICAIIINIIHLNMLSDLIIKYPNGVA